MKTLEGYRASLTSTCNVCDCEAKIYFDKQGDYLHPDQFICEKKFAHTPGPNSLVICHHLLEEMTTDKRTKKPYCPIFIEHINYMATWRAIKEENKGASASLENLAENRIQN